MFKHPSDKIYPDMAMKDTTMDMDGILPCCSSAVMRAFDENDIIADGVMVECGQCDDGMALFNGRWSAVYRMNKLRQ